MKDLVQDMIRQGDVLLVPTDASSRAAVVKRDGDGSVTLAHGEVTGHRHRLVDDHVALREPEARKTRHLSVVKTEARLLHEEHSPITVRPGQYDLPRQVEYTPEEIRNVAD